MFKTLYDNEVGRILFFNWFNLQALAGNITCGTVRTVNAVSSQASRHATIFGGVNFAFFSYKFL